MKTEISNFFVLVVLFLLGWFLVFCFLTENRKQKIFSKFQIGPKKNHQHKKEREKTSGVTLGTFSERPNPELGLILPFLAWFCL